MIASMGGGAGGMGGMDAPGFADLGADMAAGGDDDDDDGMVFHFAGEEPVILGLGLAVSYLTLSLTIRGAGLAVSCLFPSHDTRLYFPRWSDGSWARRFSSLPHPARGLDTRRIPSSPCCARDP